MTLIEKHTCILPGTPVLSMRLATLTVCPPDVVLWFTGADDPRYNWPDIQTYRDRYTCEVIGGIQIIST